MGDTIESVVPFFDEILWKVSGEEKKDLLRLIVDQIEITPSAEKKVNGRQKGREITKIKLHFDFTPDAVKKKVQKSYPKAGKLCS